MPIVNQFTKAKLWATKPVPSDVVWLKYPKSRVRLNPDLAPHVAAWLVVMANQWERTLARPRTAVTADQVRAELAYDKHLESRIKAAYELIGRVHDLVKVAELDAAVKYVDQAAALAGMPSPEQAYQHARQQDRRSGE